MFLTKQGEGRQFEIINENLAGPICGGSIVVSIRRCQRCDPGSNPGRRILFYIKAILSSCGLLSGLEKRS